MSVRLDRIPIWPYQGSLLWIVGAGYFFGFFDIVTIGYALPVITSQFHVSSSTAAMAVTSSLIGYIVGAYLDSNVADLWGRRLSLMLSVLLFTVGSLATALSPNLMWLVGWRFVTGMGIGAEIASVSAYLGEMSPAPLRGRYTGWAGAFAYAGFSAVPFVALALVPHYAWGWRVLFLIGALGGVTIALLRSGLPESPRWLMIQGRTREAEVLIQTAEATAITRLGHALPDPEPVPDEPEQKGFPTWMVLKPPFLGRLILFVAIWFVYYVGNYGWLTLAPTLLISRGYSLTNSLSYLVTSGLGFFVGAVLSAWLGDRFERKYFIMWISLGFAACLFIIGVWTIPTVIMIFGFLASVSIGLMVPLLYALTAEHFPTRARTTGVALTDGGWDTLGGHWFRSLCSQPINSMALPEHLN